jgi:uncharacterized protein (DUF2235 family)
MKRIIVCSDGTWNKPGNIDGGFVVRTNVQKIFEVIAKRDGDIPQIKHYDNGVGVIGTAVTRMVTGAMGIGLSDNIVNAYKFIVWNYEPGDEIYLFGFSRGAYTVRSLAGMIRRCGILKKQDLNMIKEAYSFYRDRIINIKTRRQRSQKFIDQNSYPNPQIKLLGVWDTVGALGIPHTSFRMWNLKKYRFHDLTLSSTIKHAYHAMAVDERRGLFNVNLWKRSAHAIENNVEQFVEQRWFPGVHAEVGGGYHEEQLSDLSLIWMIDKVRKAGLCIDMSMAVVNENFPVFLDPDPAGKPHDPLTLIHRFSPIIIRKIDQKSGFNEVIDASVLERMRLVEGYNPINVKKGMEHGIKVVETVKALFFNEQTATEKDKHPKAAKLKG